LRPSSFQLSVHSRDPTSSLPLYLAVRVAFDASTTPYSTNGTPMTDTRRRVTVPQSSPLVVFGMSTHLERHGSAIARVLICSRARDCQFFARLGRADKIPLLQSPVCDASAADLSCCCKPINDQQLIGAARNVPWKRYRQPEQARP